MPDISLQTYENEIDQLIEQARYLEALAHSRHLLNQYPRCVDAYYLLGKTMLEADLPDLAADMFRRTLSADPEHLMARIGLGVAHERRNDLDAALWNLERALELNPGSSDIAEELRRMYGRRDGVDLDYVPQTRGGLARLYLRGRRYGRAAEELCALLEEESARPDLLTALAEAYWRNDQLVQASETCQDILDKMPYNVKANLLLGTLWVNSGQEEGWIYLRRVQELDPESQYATILLGSESLLESQEVQVDRLVYDPDAIDVDRESGWFKRLEAASVSVGISEAPPEMTDAEVRLVDITAGLESQIEIPDWLRELSATEEESADAGGLGWMADMELEDASDVLEEAAESEEATTLPQTEGTPAAIETEDGESEWLQDLTVEEAALGAEAAERAPDWLRELVQDEEAEVVVEGEPEDEGTVLAESDAQDEGESLDWLRSLADTEAPEDTVSEGAGESLGLDQLRPDWLRELQATESEAEEVESTEAEVPPDWLTDQAEEAEPKEDILAAGEIPDWLSELQPAADAGESEDAKGALSESDTLDWLADLGTGDAAMEDGEDGAVDAETLGWLDVLEEAEDVETSDDVAATGEPEATEEGVPDWLMDLRPEDAAEPQVELEIAPEDVPDWLRDLETVSGEAEDGEQAAERPDVDEVADWSAFQEEVPDVTESVSATPTGSEEEDLSEVLPSEERLGDALSGEDALAWLDDLVVDEGDAPEFEAEITSEIPDDSEAEVPPSEEDIVEDGATPDVEGLPVAKVAPEDEGARIISSDGDDLLSGDAALAWLESLAVGKEEELRAQAEAESAERVAEILGRKRETPPAPPAEVETTEEDASVDKSVAEATESSVEPAAIDEIIAEAAEEPPAEPTVVHEVVAGAASEGEIDVIAAESETVQEGDMLSGDAALAWLESLAVGKEEELRAQAEVESAERVAEILGRKREMPPQQEAPEDTDVSVIEESADVSVSAELDVEVQEAEVQEAESAPPAEIDEAVVGDKEQGDDLLSGDEALAWLESLTVGKEEELRAQAEVESAERIAEILGRKREASPAPLTELEAIVEPTAEEAPEAVEELPAEPAPVGDAGVEAVPDVETAQAASVPVPMAEADAVTETPVTGEAESAFFGWSTFGEEGAEAVEVQPDTVSLTAPGGPAEPETDSGEDALAWLENLTSEREEELRAELEAALPEIASPAEAEPLPEAELEPEIESQPEVESEPEVKPLPEGKAEPESDEAFFGWSAFDDSPVEIAAPDTADEDVVVTTMDEVDGADAAAADEGAVELQPSIEVAPEPEPELGIGIASVQAQTLPKVQSSAEAEPPVAEPEPEVDAVPAAAETEPEVETSAESEVPVAEPETGDVPVEVAPEPETPTEVAAPEAVALDDGIETQGPRVETDVAAESVAEGAPVAEAPGASAMETVLAELEELKAQVKRKRSDHTSRLRLGRLLLESGDVQESMQHYARLIKSGAKTDEVMEDLERYREEIPGEPSILRTLGDAYMKFGELDKALEIFNKAMDLL